MTGQTTPRTESRLPWVLIGILGLVTCSAFETVSIVSVMPVVAAELNAVRQYGLMFALFMTASLMGTVVGGSWSDLRGPRAPTIAGFALFSIGLIICGLARSYPAMLVGRLISGGGAGLFIVALFVVLARAYDETERLKVFGYLSAAWVLPSLIGPAIAGWLAESVSWRAVFLIVPPIGLLALALMFPALAASATTDDAAPDADDAWRRARSGALLGVGSGMVQWFGQDMSMHPLAAVGVVVGLALLVPGARALLPPGVGSLAPGLPAIVGLRGLFTFSFFAAEAYVPFALATERGFSTFHSGLSLTVASIAWAGASWLLGRYEGISPRAAISLGAGSLAVGLALTAAILPLGVSGWWVLVSWSFAGFGMGLSQPTLSAQTMILADPAEQGRASAALQICDVLGTVLGLAVTGAVFAALHQQQGHDAVLLAGIWLALAVVALGTSQLTRSRVRN